MDDVQSGWKPLSLIIKWPQAIFALDNNGSKTMGHAITRLEVRDNNNSPSQRTSKFFCSHGLNFVFIELLNNAEPLRIQGLFGSTGEAVSQHRAQQYRGCLGLLHKLCSTNLIVEQLHKKLKFVEHLFRCSYNSTIFP
jgi:hypothetical protein